MKIPVVVFMSERKFNLTLKKSKFLFFFNVFVTTYVFLTGIEYQTRVEMSMILMHIDNCGKYLKYI